MPVILWFEGDQWGAYVPEEIPVPAEGDGEQQAAGMMQQVARLFEAGIRAHPQEWHMLQRVFVADLDTRAAAARGCELDPTAGSSRPVTQPAAQNRRICRRPSARPEP